MGELLMWSTFCGNNTMYRAFWSEQLSVNTSSPDLTLCFQATVLTWLPCGFLFLTTPFFLWYLSNKTPGNGFTCYGKLNWLKVVLCALMCFTQILKLAWMVKDQELIVYSNAEYLAASLMILTFLLATFLTRWEYYHREQSSLVMSLFWFLLLLCEIVQYRSSVMRKNMENLHISVSQEQFAVHTAYFVFLVIQFLLTLFPDHSALSGPEDQNLYIDEERQPLLHNDPIMPGKQEGKYVKPCQQPLAPFWAMLSFLWLTSLIFQGYRGPIEFDHLADIKEKDSTSQLLSKFNQIYYGQKENGSSQPKRSFPHALIFYLGPKYLLSSLFRAFVTVFVVINPQLLRLLLAWIEGDDTYVWKGVLISVTILITCLMNTVITSLNIMQSQYVGMLSRSVINSAVYNKALRLSSSARQQTSVGQIVNLMSVDAQKLQDGTISLNLVWATPVTITLSMMFLWGTVGASCLAGLAVLLILLPLNSGYLVNITRKLQFQQMQHKDKRVHLLGELLAGIKVIKLYAWELPFQKNVLNQRQKELRNIKNINYINAFGAMCWLLTPYLISLAIFTAYTLSSPDHILDAEKAFVTMSYINILAFPLFFLPRGVTNLTQVYVSLCRLQKFMELEELEDFVEKDNTLGDKVLKIDVARFSWGQGERTVLRDICLEIASGSLTAIVGQVGSGKSSLLSAMLGEMTMNHGSVRVNGSLAYVPQQAWIQHTSLKYNILFGKPLSQETYDKCIQACALGPDINILPAGDMTEIGEKGINLSGGQKQRVSLARAVYQDEDIYLLDDPLSAVDAHVGKHIFDNVIGPKGMLKHKTRVLVTHSLTYLSQVDYIVVLSQGKVSEEGSYEDLLQGNGVFADLPKPYDNAKDEDVSKDKLSECEEMQIIQKNLTSSESEKYDALISCQRKRSQCDVTRHNTNTEKSSKDMKGKLVDTEVVEVGTIRPQVLKSYILSGGMKWFFLICVCFLMLIGLQVYTNIWLSMWSSDGQTESNNMYLGIYGGLIGAQAVSALIQAMGIAFGCYCASRVLHEKLLNRILYAPMAFFDTTPLGRIMNRFSKDVDTVDQNMPVLIRQWMFAVIPLLNTITVIAYSTPIFLAVLAPLCIVYMCAQRMYMCTVRQLKRIDNVKRSPIYSHFDESIVGATSIRAYKREEEFRVKCDQLVDESQRPYFLILHSYRWCSVVMETLGALVAFFAALFAVLSKGNISSSNVGLSVSYALQGPRNMTGNTPPPDWPDKGRIEFHDFATRYRSGLELVLKGVNCNIGSSEKVGIVGRTGAGKSSLSLCLFRLIERVQGKIIIDGRNIAKMGLEDLRSKLTIIPQDPIVFCGSIKRNLDPFRHHSDEDIWKALELSHMKNFVMSLQNKLEYECGQGGEALSVGQRQLLCLARASLRKSRVLILDEATAAVDIETDALIQHTISSHFQHCTVLTVAHRLNTVFDYDRIMVLDDGEIKEFDTPANLLKDHRSSLYSMAKNAGLVS